MEIKYVILRSNECNGRWSYYGGPKTYREPYKNTYVINKYDDRYLNTDVKDAVLYDTKEQAIEEIKNFMAMVEHPDPKTKKYLGVGIFKIEEVYINTMPKDDVRNQKVELSE